MQPYSSPVVLKTRAVHGPTKLPFWRRIFRKGALPSPQYVITFTPVNDDNMILPIIVGDWEAKGIAIILEGIVSERPLTSDLLKAATDQFGYTLEYSIIHKVDQKGLLYAAIHYTNGEKQVVLDARPSDAIVAALLAKKPVMIEKELLGKYCWKGEAVITEDKAAFF